MNQPTSSDAADLAKFASPSAVSSALYRAAAGFRSSGHWLSARHVYGLQDLTSKLLQAPRHPSRLAEYVACSAPLHLADGWNFLSRAFDSALHGDRSSAIHLAYYAELRASMSLLATEGIGVFNNRHYAFDDQMNTIQLKGKTHDATWDLLCAWADDAQSSARLLNLISIENRSLADWLELAGVVAPTQHQIAREWLRTWSVDLDVFSRDQKWRNEMSYRPTRILSRRLRPVSVELELIEPLYSTWEELQPIGPGVLTMLDVSLLRRALSSVVTQGQCNYGTLAATIRSLTRVDQPLTNSTYMSLQYQSASAKMLFGAAKRKSHVDRAATPVIARALLMLRLASAATSVLLSDANISRSDLEFWLDPLGADHGLWESINDVQAFEDLMAEVWTAKDSADQCIARFQGVHSVSSTGRCLLDNAVLTQFLRAPMWLLGL